MKNQETLDEILFEHRNRAYGAYQLRTMYPKTLRRALISGIGIALFVAGSSFVYLSKVKKKEVLRGVVLTTITPPPPPPDETAPPPPPPPTPPPAPVVEKVIAFTIPEPVVDELPIIETPPPSQDDLANAHIGTENVDGADATGSLVFHAPPPPVQPTKEDAMTKIDNPNDIFLSVEENPEFMGGTTEMYRWLSKNLSYPAVAQRSGISGKVFVSFVVEKDGKITSPKVLKGIGFGCDDEALRVLKSMPAWSPGKQNGRPVRVQFTIPIAFILE